MIFKKRRTKRFRHLIAATASLAFAAMLYCAARGQFGRRLASRVFSLLLESGAEAGLLLARQLTFYRSLLLASKGILPAGSEHILTAKPVLMAIAKSKQEHVSIAHESKH
jgi:hypothetical protein